MPDDIVLIVSSAHPWHGRKHVTLEELRGEPLLLRERGSGTRAALETALREAGADIATFRVVGEIQQDMDRLQSQRADLERFFAKAENRDLQDRAKFIGNVIEARSFNWTKMFMELEHTLPAGAHIIRIDPKLEAGTVSVKFSIGGTSPGVKVELLKAFEDSKSFTHIELTSTGVNQQAGAGAADVFVLEFSAIYTGI